jgi:hypothetical protein
MASFFFSLARESPEAVFAAGNVSETARTVREYSGKERALAGIAKANTASTAAINKLFIPIRPINILKINLQK